MVFDKIVFGKIDFTNEMLEDKKLSRGSLTELLLSQLAYR